MFKMYKLSLFITVEIVYNVSFPCTYIGTKTHHFGSTFLYIMWLLYILITKMCSSTVTVENFIPQMLKA
jgi:hypothetical protein